MHDLRLVLRAARFAAHWHRAQRRKFGDIPYINHPVSVANRLAEQGGIDDAITLAAALLHDTIEDTGATSSQLSTEFGDEVAAVVVEVTDDKRQTKAERKRHQIERSARLSKRARLVKLADKLDNLEELAAAPPPAWGDDRVAGYFVWAHAVVDNLRGVNPRLEQALDAVFAREITLHGGLVRAVPADPAARSRELERYLRSLAGVDD